MPGCTILHKNGLSNAQIAAQLNLTIWQVRYAIHHPATPKKHSGRPDKITQIKLDYLIEWVATSQFLHDPSCYTQTGFCSTRCSTKASYFWRKSREASTICSITYHMNAETMGGDTLELWDVDYCWPTYKNMGYTSKRRRVGSYLYCWMRAT